MKRHHLVTGPLAVIALTLTACGSSGPKTLNEDDFVSQLNAICRTADKAIADLDPSSKKYIGDITDATQTALDDATKLKAPKALQSDFDDFTSSLDSIISTFGKLAKAIKNKDTNAQDAAVKKLDSLTKDTNDTAAALGAKKCQDVGGGVTTAPTDTAAPETTASETTDTPTTDTEAPATTDSIPDTSTANTPLPIDSSVDTSTATTFSVPSTSSSTGVAATDAAISWAPIAGYKWGTFEDLPGVQTPTNDPVIGPLLDYYDVGVLENLADGTLVGVYITSIAQNTDWTAAQLNAYYTFELVGNGVDSVTPGGYKARVKPGATDHYDAGVITVPGLGVSLLAPKGSNMIALLDGFALAQTSMSS